MAIVSNQRKSDKNLYNRQTEEYIPISCHYDPYTLLTKNGELLQVISIPGILSDNLSYDLREVTQVARISLAKNIQSINVGCWIHNIRRKRNIDDSLEHSNIFSKDLHNEWAKKHNLKSSFTNCLYITVIMKGLAVGLNDVSNIIASTSSSTVIDKHEAHLQSTSESLNLITQSILKDLDIYGAEKLGLKFKNGIYYSDLLSLYNHLCNLNEHDTELPIKDLSEFLSIEGFAIGSRQIEVVQGTNRNFASILSIKEYHNSGQENLLSNLFLAPIEFIATEIFYPIEKDKVFDEYSHQNYILDVTKDDQLQKAKGLDIMMNPTRSEGFIMQQLSIMVISDDLDNLEQDTKKLSKLLSSIGIVHVREDINLENIFWSQIPGNFRYMRRNIGNVADNIGPFLSLQLSPHGKKESPWGKYITVMYGTEKSPYFINLHNKKNTGHTCIFGNKNSGKTTFMNFLVSETMKYNPTIIYFALDDTPELFVNAIGGTWHNQPVLPEIEDMNYIVAIIDLLSGKYSSGINEIENKVLDTLLSKIKTLSNYTEISQIIENLDFGLDAANLKNNLFKILPYFKSNNIKLAKSNIIGINLSSLLGSENIDLRASFMIASMKALGIDRNSPKMFVMDEMENILDHAYFANNMNLFYELAKIYNIVVMGSVDTEKYINVTQKKLWDIVDENTDFKVVMPHQNISYNLEKIFGLTSEESHSLGKTQYDSSFIIKPSGHSSTMINFNSAGLDKYMHILSCNDDSKKLFIEAKSAKGESLGNWLPELYRMLEK